MNKYKIIQNKITNNISVNEIHNFIVTNNIVRNIESNVSKVLGYRILDTFKASEYVNRINYFQYKDINSFELDFKSMETITNNLFIDFCQTVDDGFGEYENESDASADREEFSDIRFHKGTSLHYFCYAKLLNINSTKEACLYLEYFCRIKDSKETLDIIKSLMESSTS